MKSEGTCPSIHTNPRNYKVNEEGIDQENGQESENDMGLFDDDQADEDDIVILESDEADFS